MPRDTTAAANILIKANAAYLQEIAFRDPSMIRDVAAALLYERDHAAKPKFETVSCSQCGKSFGPGDHGFSTCDSHASLAAMRE